MKKKEKGNMSIQRKAIEYIMGREKGLEEVRQKGKGYDLKGNGKLVEVKGTSQSEFLKGLVLTGEEVKNLKKPNFWIYRVINIGRKKRTKIIRRQWDYLKKKGLEPKQENRFYFRRKK